MGLEITVIGKGCYFCKTLHNMVGEILQELGVDDAKVEQTDDLEALLDFGVVNPPALVVNGKLRLMGRVLVRTHVRQALEEGLREAAGAPAADSPGK